MSPNVQTSAGELDDNHTRTQTQPDQARMGMKSNIESDENDLSLFTPQGMSMNTPYMARNPDHQQNHVMTTASGMDTMANTMTPIGDYQEKASIMQSQDQDQE